MRNVAFLTGLLLSSFSAFAQNNFWSDIREQSIQTNGERRIIPDVYRTQILNFEAMRQFLSTAPDEADVNNGFSEGVTLSLPFPDGRLVRFRIWESSIMHPEFTGAVSANPNLCRARHRPTPDADPLRPNPYGFSRHGFRY